MADTIFNHLTADGGFKTFVALITVCDGLAEVLNGKNPVTVFAPTDEAFSKLEPGTVEKWRMDTDLLLDIFRYHMIYGEHTSEELKGMAKDKKSINAADNNPLSFEIKGDTLSVGNAKEKADVNKADIKCSNGVIHIIDKVLSL